MLVLSRRSHESIRIGDSIVITVLEVRGDHVRIGIDAPSEVEVHRQEVYEAIQAANRSAASPTAASLAAAAGALRNLAAPAPAARGSSTPDAQEVPADAAGTSGTATS